MIRNSGLCTLVLSATVFFTSCISNEKLRKEQVYFNEGLDTAKISQYILQEPIIQKGDLLQISIASRSSASNQLFSNNYSSGGLTQGNNSASVMGGGSAANSYLVDIVTGEIKLPLLGVILADGMTKLELEREIVKRSSEFLKEDPIVNIRYLNFKVTFLGSVLTPGSKTFESERVTFLDALGIVGGVSPGGDLKKILLIREQNGKRTSQLIDLTNGAFFNSSNFYLKQNDVVYISPTNRQLKAADPTFNRTFQLVNIGIAAVNLIVILITLVR
jgi:polysaccharide biosynthesis/export protein